MLVALRCNFALVSGVNCPLRPRGDSVGNRCLLNPGQQNWLWGEKDLLHWKVHGFRESKREREDYLFWQASHSSKCPHQARPRFHARFLSCAPLSCFSLHENRFKYDLSHTGRSGWGLWGGYNHPHIMNMIIAPSPHWCVKGLSSFTGLTLAQALKAAGAWGLIVSFTAGFLVWLALGVYYCGLCGSEMSSPHLHVPAWSSWTWPVLMHQLGNALFCIH